MDLRYILYRGVVSGGRDQIANIVIKAFDDGVYDVDALRTILDNPDIPDGIWDFMVEILQDGRLLDFAKSTPDFVLALVSATHVQTKEARKKQLSALEDLWLARLKS